jgi:hypothetical protein
MYRFLFASLFCAVASATPALPHQLATPKTGQVLAQAEIIKTAAVGPGLRAESRTKRAPAAVSTDDDSPAEPAKQHMVLAAIALMAGIAFRRYRVSRK